MQHFHHKDDRKPEETKVFTPSQNFYVNSFVSACFWFLVNAFRRIVEGFYGPD